MPEQCKVDYLVYTLSYEVKTALIGKSSHINMTDKHSILMTITAIVYDLLFLASIVHVGQASSIQAPVFRFWYCIFLSRKACSHVP